jgi:hypothetical protein
MLAFALQIRSVLLDDISKTEGVLIRSIGNQRSNAIWEAGIAHQTGWTKPTATDDRKRKEDFIKSKYQWKGFIDYSNAVGESEKDREAKLSCDVYEAAKQSDLWGIAEALAKGGSVQWNNLADEGKTPLHVCVLTDEGQNGEAGGFDDSSQKKRAFQAIVCAEFLIQNGAKLSAMDGNDHSVLDCAVCGNAPREIVEFITARGQ